MDYTSILNPVLALGLMGLIFGALLAVASKVFAVEKNEKLDEVQEALPGANCGACGFAGCSNYASAIVNDGAPLNKCAVGGEAVYQTIAQIMGQAAEEQTPMVAHVNCRGTGVKQKFNYVGLSDCVAVLKLAGGQSACSFGCLGLGTCAKVCPYDAISIREGVAVVDPEKCKACRKCIDNCPRHIISLVPKKAKVHISCMSEAKGVQVRDICPTGCIGCHLCEKNCPVGAIVVENDLAKIDYEKCLSCGKCARVCPRSLITINGEAPAKEPAKPAEKAE